MEEILNNLLYLFILIVINIATGLYYNIGKLKTEFNWKIFWTGIVKSLIVGLSFVGLTFVFDNTNMSEIGITPQAIMNSALLLYGGKAVINLSRILGVKNNENNLEETIEKSARKEFE